jgi:hypothetical protein
VAEANRLRDLSERASAIGRNRDANGQQTDAVRCLYGGVPVSGDRCAPATEFRPEGQRDGQAAGPLQCSEEDRRAGRTALCNPLLFGSVPAAGGSGERALCVQRSSNATERCEDARQNSGEACRNTSTAGRTEVAASPGAAQPPQTAGPASPQCQPDRRAAELLEQNPQQAAQLLATLERVCSSARPGDQQGRLAGSTDEARRAREEAGIHDMLVYRRNEQRPATPATRTPASTTAGAPVPPQTPAAPTPQRTARSPESLRRALADVDSTCRRVAGRIAALRAAAGQGAGATLQRLGQAADRHLQPSGQGTGAR